MRKVRNEKTLTDFYKNKAFVINKNFQKSKFV